MNNIMYGVVFPNQHFRWNVVLGYAEVQVICPDPSSQVGLGTRLGGHLNDSSPFHNLEAVLGMNLSDAK